MDEGERLEVGLYDSLAAPLVDVVVVVVVVKPI
jgi:hypothetical protein